MQHDTLFGDIPKGVAKESDEYYTPKWIFDALRCTFDIDVAAPLLGPRFTPCKRYFTIHDNGLEQPWEGLVWMNPPYSKTTPWIKKWTRHGNGIALVPAAKSQWFSDAWENDSIGIMATSYKLKFIKPTGEEASIFTPVVLMGIGEGRDILKASTIGRMR